VGEAAPWSPYVKVTGNVRLVYTWTEGRDNIGVSANSINDSQYRYNNLAACYATWYPKFGQSKWHMAWEAWYAAASLPIVNCNGASRGTAHQVPVLAGYRGPTYRLQNPALRAWDRVETTGWERLGITLVFRPEGRYDVVYDAPACDSGTRGAGSRGLRRREIARVTAVTACHGDADGLLRTAPLQ
jgi:hypothetical protein